MMPVLILEPEMVVTLLFTSVAAPPGCSEETPEDAPETTVEAATSPILTCPDMSKFVPSHSI